MKTTRKIKFRGKDKEGVWYYGYYWKSLDGIAFIKPIIESDAFYDISSVEVIPETVGQYTGIGEHDAEIYEDDLFEIEYTEKRADIDKLIIRLVCVFAPDASFTLKRIDDGSHSPYSLKYGGSLIKRKEKIGNIHDNPELFIGG